MEIECNIKVDIDEVISQCENKDLVELCQDVFDSMPDEQKQEFLHDNFDSIKTDDIKDLYHERLGDKAMTKEEIIKGGRPSEPYCFETDTEERWYNIGLYDGATAETKSPWVSVKEKLPSPYENVFIAGLAGRCMGVGGVDYVNGEGKWQHYAGVDYWMPIPPIPQK